jgi:hypothetical protein
MEMAKYLYNQDAVANLKLSDTAALDRLIDFESAREAHLEKERAKKDKRMSLTEAIATFVQNGDIITDAGFSYVRTPHQAFNEIIRQGKKNLQMIGAPNTNQSFLIVYDCVAYSHNSYSGAEMRGISRSYDRMLKVRRVKILSEWSHGDGGGRTGAQGCPARHPGRFQQADARQ